ncbi:hypothetical protein EDB89DRAFT_1970439 [Lactarius sanguifluus]|nr:hypothetical protein EDB89DRAFT_1970439 [Lactarius sanguifluus]
MSTNLEDFAALFSRSFISGAHTYRYTHATVLSAMAANCDMHDTCSATHPTNPSHFFLSALKTLSQLPKTNLLLHWMNWRAPAHCSAQTECPSQTFSTRQTRPTFTAQQRMRLNKHRKRARVVRMSRMTFPRTSLWTQSQYPQPLIPTAVGLDTGDIRPADTCP